MHVLFTEDGEMDKRVFLATWKDIPVPNEVQHEIRDVQHNAGLCGYGIHIILTFFGQFCLASY